MENIPTLHLKILQERLNGITYELTQVRFCPQGGQPAWRPRINVYRCLDRIVVCAELAGLGREDIDLRVEPLRLWLGARRPMPLPAAAHGQLLQILALEIDEGPGGREILLPEEVLPDEVRAEQRNGLLWIELPLRSAE